MNWNNILIDCHNEVREKVLPLIGTIEGGGTYGKGAGGDQMKQVDLIAEKAIINTLCKHVVSCTLISEEAGIVKIGSQPDKLYVTTDPIDGSTNASRGIPFVATSIAVSSKPKLKSVYAALVSDLIHNTIYTAHLGEGAFRDNVKINISNANSLEDAVVGIDLKLYKTGSHVDSVSKLLENLGHPRHFGANALELCYVADGTTDAFIDVAGKLRITDIAGAYLILKESGALLTTPSGGILDAPLHPKQTVAIIAAANSMLHNRIKKYFTTPSSNLV